MAQPIRQIKLCTRPAILRVCLDRLILLKLKIYYWNHCNKIIFKCINNTVGPIFNEKIDKKWNLWIRKQCTYVLFTENWSKVTATVHVPYINSSRKWEENAWKKKKKKRKTQKLKRSKRNPNTHLHSSLFNFLLLHFRSFFFFLILLLYFQFAH